MGLVWFGNPPIMETYSQTFQMTACPYQSLLPQTTKALQKKTQKKREFCWQPKCYKKNNKYSILSPCCLVLLPNFSINLGEKNFANISCQDIYFIIRFFYQIDPHQNYFYQNYPTNILTNIYQRMIRRIKKAPAGDHWARDLLLPQPVKRLGVNNTLISYIMLGKQ